MIYLIDENDYKVQEEFNVDYLDKYSFIEPIYRIGVHNIKQIKKKLINAEAIFYHKNFLTCNEEGELIRNTDIIQEVYFLIIENKIPFVKISNGIKGIECIDGNKQLVMNKNEFYKNLKLFLDDDELNFKLLAYGGSYKEKVARDISTKIINNFRKLENDKTIRIKDNIDFKSIIDYSELSDYFKLTYSKGDFVDFLNMLKGKNYTYKELIKLIKKINYSLLKYQRNIYF